MRVIKAFVDKDTGKGYSTGGMYESKDSKRIAFLYEQGFISKPKKTGKKTKKDGE